MFLKYTVAMEDIESMIIYKKTTTSKFINIILKIQKY